MKRKIQINRPKISSEEIAKHRDFDQVLSQYQTVTKPFYKKGWFLSGMAAAVLIGGILIYNHSEVQPDDLIVNVEKPFVNPPLKGVNIPLEDFLINVDEPSEIMKSNGTSIQIPAHAFVDENGNEVKGEVLIKYREFHDQVDIMLSGIPMVFDSGGVKYQFESAGMMEIQGFKNGDPIFVKKDKSLNVFLASKIDGENYNLYFLDTVNRNWVNKGGNTVIRMDAESRKIIHKKMPKTDSISKVEEIILPEPEKPLPPRKREDENYVFEIDILPNEFPELAGYNGAVFQVIEEKSEFKESFYKVQWEKLDMKKVEGHNDEYIMTVTKGKKSYELYVVPVFEGQNYDLAKKTFDRKYAEYQRKLSDKQAKLKRLKEEREKKIAEMKAKWKSDSLANVAINEQYLANAKGEGSLNEFSLRRNFEINGFGVYNCDRSLPATYEKFNAEFVIGDHDYFYSTVRLIDKNINSVFTIGVRGDHKSTIQMDVESENIIFAFLDDGKVAVYHQKDKINPKNYETLQLKMKLYDNLRTVEDFKELVNI